MTFKVGDKVTLVKYIANPLSLTLLGMQGVITEIDCDDDDENYPIRVKLNNYPSDVNASPLELELVDESPRGRLFSALSKEGL